MNVALPPMATLVGLTGDPARGTLPYVDPPPPAASGALWFAEPGWDHVVHKILRAWLSGPGGPRLEGRWEDLVAHTRAIATPGGVYPLGDGAVALRYTRSCILWSHGRAMPYCAHGEHPLAEEVFDRLTALAPVLQATARAPWWCIGERPVGPWPRGAVLPIWSPAFPHWKVDGHDARMAFLGDIALATRLPAGDRMALMTGTVGPRGVLQPPQVFHTQEGTPNVPRPLRMDTARALGGWDRCFSYQARQIASLVVPESAPTSGHVAMAVETERGAARARLLPFLALGTPPDSWGIDSLHAA